MNNIFEITELQTLENYIELNYSNIQDFFNKGFDELFEQREKFRKYILLNSAFRNLTATKQTNAAYLIILFNYFERIFPDRTCCNIIYKKLKDAGVKAGNRLEAASLFLFVNDNPSYISRYDEIVNRLQIAYDCEEDNKDNAVITFANYFLNVLVNPPATGNIFIRQLTDKIIESKSNGNHYFLNHHLVEFLLSLDVTDTVNSQKLIRERTDDLLKSSTIKPIDTPPEYLIETNTEYSRALSDIKASFDDIKSLSVKFSNNIINGNEVHYSLQRGIAILQSEEQMFYYQRNFGNMHKEKLLSAIKYLKPDMFSRDVEIIDWACGQGIASMVFLDKIPDIKKHIKKIILIEPSTICLKRASLHLNKYLNNIDLITINKDLDSLRNEDVKTKSDSFKIHLFSNIIDYTGFSLGNLFTLLSDTQKKENLFVCVSPYIDIPKSERVLSFAGYFRNKYPGTFQILCEETNSKSDPYWNCNNNVTTGKCYNHTEVNDRCQKKWTKIISVFKVNID